MAEKKKTHENWGGKREGAGRPKTIKGQTQNVSAIVGQDVYDWVVSQPETTSKFIHRILKERMEQELNNNKD